MNEYDMEGWSDIDLIGPYLEEKKATRQFTSFSRRC